jgi:hypothetical protein
MCQVVVIIYLLGTGKQTGRRVFEIAQDKEFKCFNLSDKAFVLTSQLLWTKRILEKYLGPCSGDIVAKTCINLRTLASPRKNSR